MAGIKGVTAHNAKITVDRLMSLLRENHGKGFSVRTLARHFDCGDTAVTMVARRLVMSGAISLTKTRGRFFLYHVGDLTEEMQLIQIEPVVATASDLVPSFKPDNWKPPMQDYGSKLAQHATLAMLSRRA